MHRYVNPEIRVYFGAFLQKYANAFLFIKTSYYAMVYANFLTHKVKHKTFIGLKYEF